MFDQLTPDQKSKFLDNLNQWKAMSPEEQELFRDRELFRRQKIASEIQDALGKSGLHLDDDQREVYVLRYTQERRKIEEALHKEMDHQRQVMVADMLARLKVEFSATPTPGPATPP
jgi:dsDNA-binding SOS-regulon protein